MSKEYNAFVCFFNNLTETKILLAFGEEGAKVTAEHLLRNVLYRESFFGEDRGRRLSDVQAKLRGMSCNFSESVVATGLYKQSKGKDAVLTRRGKRKNYTYHERYPPKEIFKTAV